MSLDGVTQISPVLLDVGFGLSDALPLCAPLGAADAGPRLVDLGSSWQVQLHAQIDAAHHADIPFTITQPASVEVALRPGIEDGIVWAPPSLTLRGDPLRALLIGATFAKADYASTAADLARIDITGVVSTYARWGDPGGIS